MNLNLIQKVFLVQSSLVDTRLNSVNDFVDLIWLKYGKNSLRTLLKILSRCSLAKAMGISKLQPILSLAASYLVSQFKT